MRMLLLHLLLMPFILAEENIFLDVIDYSHSEIQLSCRLEADWDMTNVYFKVSKGKDVCLYSTYERCETPTNCHMACLKNKDPKIILFWVKLDGRCDETTNIHCRIGSEQENVEKSIILKTQSDPPAISVNDGKPVEANYSEVQISCSISNVCHKTKLEIWGVAMETVNTTHQKEGSRFKTTTISRAILNGAGNYEIFCKESDKEDQYTRSYIFVVLPSKNDTQDTDTRHVTKTPISPSDIGLIAVLFTFICLLSTCFFLAWRWHRKSSKLKTERGSYNSVSSNDPPDRRNTANQQRRFLPVLQESPGDCICGIWIKGDETNGEILKSYIESQHGTVVRRAEIEKVDFIQEGPYYEKYFAMISVDSLKNQNFMAYLALVVSRTYNVASKFSVVLVLVDKDALSILDWRRNSSDDLDRRNMMIKLQDLPSVNAFFGSVEDSQHRIADELQRPPPSTKDTNAFVNIGAGLAWSYYYGYLALILPEISNRIEKFKDKIKRHGRMSPYFIIIVPESCRVHSKLKDVDPQFSSEEFLDDRKNKSITGYPECPSKNVVHHIKKNEGDCYYFCGEYATPVAFLDKMQRDGMLTEVEMTKEQLLFTKTLQSILHMHSSYGGNTVIYTFKDVAVMAEGLSDFVIKQNKLHHPYYKELMQVTRVAEGLALSYYYYYLAIIGPKMEERIKSSKIYSSEKMTNKFYILLPYSCQSYEKLERAEQKNIKYIDNLDPPKTNEVRATENNWIYETAIYEISANRQKYFACVEYCTLVQVMNQMAKMEWTPVQKARELRVLYETLHTLLYGPNAPAYCSTFELVYYDDKKEKLSTKLVTKIDEVMNINQENAASNFGIHSEDSNSENFLNRHESKHF